MSLLFIPDSKISKFKYWSTEEGSWVSSYGSKIQRKSLTGPTDCKYKLCNDKLTVNEWGWVSYEEQMEIEEGVITAKADKTLRDLHNSSYDTKAEFNICFIIHSK